jgi:hypothetical protein
LTTSQRQRKGVRKKSDPIHIYINTPAAQDTTEERENKQEHTTKEEMEGKGKGKKR